MLPPANSGSETRARFGPDAQRVRSTGRLKSFVRLAVVLALFLGLGESASAAATANTSMPLAPPKVCALLTQGQLSGLLGGSLRGAARTSDTSTTCAYENSGTGAELEIDLSSVNSADSLSRVSRASIAGYLECAVAKLKKETGSGGELGYSCGSPTHMEIEKGTVYLHLQAPASVAVCLAAANGIFSKLHAT
jgi:hypothetical protein